MSRHVIQEQPEVVVGWDQPMGTFFAQVYGPEPEGICEDADCELHEIVGPHPRKDCEDNDPILWVGGHFNEVLTVQQLKRVMGEYAAAITLDMERQLQYDQDEGIM